MTDKPGSPDDMATAADLAAIIQLVSDDGPDARRRATELAHRIEARHPGLLERMVSGLQLDRLRRRSAQGTA